MADSKLQKPEQSTALTATTGFDRISNLPDSLLCHILSFLPTTTSVTTCILSRRWRYLWQHLRVFNLFPDPFYLRQPVPGEAPKRFVAFVNEVLSHSKARDIRTFCLSYDASTNINDAMTTWVRTATGPHLEKMQLYLCRFEDEWTFVAPPSIFACTSLVTLVLVGRIVVELAQTSSFHLPSLKLLRMRLNSLDCVDTILSACPALEFLYLFFDGEQVRPPKMGAPKFRMPSALKSLTFIYSANYGIEELEINTPSLEYLNIAVATKCHKFSVRNLHNVVEARLDSCNVDTVMLLKELGTTKILVMQPSSVMRLLRAPVLDLPEFSNLLNLELNLPYFDTSFLMNMLHRCHVLQVLTIHKATDVSPSWTQPTNVPSCLVSHLAVIKFETYYDSEDDKEFIAYILKNGLVLKAVTIDIAFNFCLDLEKKQHIREELSIMPRGSKMCQLRV